MSDPTEVVAVGDVYVNRKYPKTAAALVADTFAAADLRIGNLESSVSDEGEKGQLAAPWLRAPAENLEGVVDLFDMVSMANNHTMDYGAEALVDTIETLEDHDIDVAGAGRDLDEAESVVSTDVNDTTFGLVAFDALQGTMSLTAQAQPERAGITTLDVSPLFPEPHVDELSEQRVERIVAEAADNVDFLFSMFHYGTGYTTTVPQKHLSRVAIDAGADFVLGTHAHVPQGVDIYRSKPILYGLGHFFWDSFADKYTLMDKHSFSRETVLAKITIGDDVEGVQLYPAYIDENDQPGLLEPSDTRYGEIAEKIVTLSAEGTIEEADDHLQLLL